MISNFGDFINYILGFINLLMPVLAGLALLSFLWGTARFISKAGDAGGRAEGKSLMIYGLIALFLMFSFYAIVKIAQKDLGLNTRTGIPFIKR